MRMLLFFLPRPAHGKQKAKANTMNKLPAHMENPIDLVLLRATATTLPLFHSTGHTPNMLTTYSFMLGLAAVAALWWECVGLFTITFALSYLFDCMDGQATIRIVP
jgi:hypothetical protein